MFDKSQKVDSDKILYHFPNRKEQEELKGEMEKMSELIAELRENCQKLQTELLDSRNNHQQKPEPKPRRDTSTVGVQVTLLTGNNH